MDEIRRLENQIRELQRELERQNTEAARMRQNLANENLRKLRAYEAEMQTNLDQHDKAVQREYEKRLKEYQRSVNEEIQERQLQMDVDYQKLLVSTQQKEREWIEKTQQLEQLISELKKNTQDKDSASAYEAKKYMTEAALKYKDVEKKPHEKFFPKRIKMYHTAICEARTLQIRGLNEAAIAIFISARSGLSRLGFDVDEQFEEWNVQYQLFKSKVGLIHMKLMDELAVWHSFAKGTSTETRKLSESEKEEAKKSINYWSGGIYGEISNRVAVFGKEIGEAEKEGVLQYLKKEQSISMEELKKNISEIDTMNEELEKAVTLYKERYNASCQRADWGEMIIDFLTDEINLVWIDDESHFREVSSEVGEKIDYLQYMELQYGEEYDAVDTREWLELVFTNSMETKIFIYIVPYEKDSHVENRLVIYVDYTGAVNEDYSRQIYSHICESIRLEDDDGIVNFASDVDQLKTNVNATLRAAGKSIESKIRKMR